MCLHCLFRRSAPLKPLSVSEVCQIHPGRKLLDVLTRTRTRHPELDRLPPTERISSPELDDIVTGVRSRNHKFTLGDMVEEAKMDNDGS
jgi:hypothetical protein